MIVSTNFDFSLSQEFQAPIHYFLIAIYKGGIILCEFSSFFEITFLLVDNMVDYSNLKFLNLQAKELEFIFL